MPAFKFSLFIFCLILFSCKNKQTSRYSNLLLGDWIYIKNDSTKDASQFEENLIEGYSFLDSGICHKKSGYFKQVITKIPAMENAIGDRTEERTTYFLGTETKYKIEDDSLKIFNLSDSTWEASKILTLSSDTILLQLRNQSKVKFAKSKLQTKSNILFDELVVSASGCLGTCPINNTIIKKSGEAIYFGEDYTKKDGLYTFSLTKDQFNQIKSNFNHANINALKNEYVSDWTDDEEITLTFIKDGKIIKSIRDYGNAAPTELYWAYMPVRNFYQLKKLDTLNLIQSPISQTRDLMFSLGITLGLSKSAAFYLWDLLRQAKEIEESFTKKYEIDIHGTDKIEKVVTDGRFFNFKSIDGNEKTLDIGYNFFEVNEMTKRFKNNMNIKFCN